MKHNKRIDYLTMGLFASSILLSLGSYFSVQGEEGNDAPTKPQPQNQQSPESNQSIQKESTTSLALDGTKAGEKKTITIKGIDYTFRWCPPGTFMMGSPESEEGRLNYETQHKVTLTKGFWMLESEITQEMWESVMGENPSVFKGKNLPVEAVNWSDCQKFLSKWNSLNVKGLEARLPTEAQWEYACRAGTTGAYGGTGDLDDMGWYKDNSNNETHPVKSKKPNDWGFYDMHGNVWEWCKDCYEYYPASSVTDPVGASSASARVFRGGSWIIGAGRCRSAYRSSSEPAARYNSLGFRVLLVR